MNPVKSKKYIYIKITTSKYLLDNLILKYNGHTSASSNTTSHYDADIILFSQDQLSWRLAMFRKYHALRFLSPLQPLYLSWPTKKPLKMHMHAISLEISNQMEGYWSIPTATTLYLCPIYCLFVRVSFLSISSNWKWNFNETLIEKRQWTQTQ